MQRPLQLRVDVERRQGVATDDTILTSARWRAELYLFVSDFRIVTAPPNFLEAVCSIASELDALGAPE